MYLNIQKYIYNTTNIDIIHQKCVYNTQIIIKKKLKFYLFNYVVLLHYIKMINTGVIRTYHDEDNTILKEEYFQINNKKDGKK